ncbi:MAG: hypothetical protein QGH60_08205 [Phycisphaerae bacterium]|jgi:hypothetical protein|nr:hypothetical protein [Phycisphaerae bacterium]
MKNVNAKSKYLLLTAMVIALMSVSVSCSTSSSLSTGAKSWKDETVLISPRGDQTVVRPFEGDRVLFKNADPQLAIEWGMANARTTMVMAGKYVVSESIDIPRDAVTLIIGQGAEISLNPKTEHKTDVGFRSRNSPGYWQLVPLIYNRGHDNVRVIHLGTLVHSVWEHSVWEDGNRAKQTFPIVFDGRNAKRTCGVKGGLLLVTGSTAQSCLLLDARGVHVPLLTPDFTALDSALDAVLVLEGCEDCKLGMTVNLPPESGGMTGVTVALNSRNRGITIERLLGEGWIEIIKCNESHATVGEVVFVGSPQELLMTTKDSRPRWTSKPRTGSVSLDVKKKTILEDARGSALRVEVPKLPDALPRFTVKATAEVTMKDGSKKKYTKEVEIDVRK